MKTGVLLVNLGSPISPKPKDVKKYLIEFLTDRRVIDLPFLQRHLLVRGVIVPKRYRSSARLYQSIWQKEGSPLMIHSKNVAQALQDQLGHSYQVELAMRYQFPSISDRLNALKGVDRLIVFPLFPQYASATTGSVCEKVLKHLNTWNTIPALRIITSYCDHPSFIEAHLARARDYPIETYDHILFSYHGLPERHIRKADLTGTCLITKSCCENNANCYAAQCLKTTTHLAAKLNIPREKWSMAFQSRLGKVPWLRPYADHTIETLARNGKKKVLVFSPSFVADCLETLEEIAIQYKKIFIEKGGETLDLVHSLNSHPKWIEAIQTIAITQGEASSFFP